MAKKRFQCWLSEAALVELERRAGAPDKRQAYLEDWLTTDRPKPPSTESLPKVLAAVEDVTSEDLLRAAQAKLETRRAEKPVTLCEHGFEPAFCKVAKCRKT